MRLPSWYKKTVVIWVVLAPAFWWFAAAFNGASFFSLPKFYGPDDGSLWPAGLLFQLGIMALLIAPVTFLPFAIRDARRGNAADTRK